MTQHPSRESLLALLIDSDCPSSLAERAGLFSESRGIPICSSESTSDFPYLLHYSNEGVRLLHSGKSTAGPISASFLEGKNRHRMKHGGGRGQLIAKAVGLKGSLNPSVFDATGGLGRDAFVLATLGCRVRICERSPVVRELLHHALLEATGAPDSGIAEIASRMELLECDAIEYLAEARESVADVIYLDPMYPEQRKSAAVKKEMRAFHDLVGHDLDDEDLLAQALKKARYRVVVKRPRKGEEIRGIKPSLKLEGKSSRYDIYALRKLPSV